MYDIRVILRNKNYVLIKPDVHYLNLYIFTKNRKRKMNFWKVKGGKEMNIYIYIYIYIFL